MRRTTACLSAVCLLLLTACGDADEANVDAVGDSAAVQNTYTYLPFGEITAQTGTVANRFTFAGSYGVQDDVGSNYFMRHREYHAGLGRFISRDRAATWR